MNQHLQRIQEIIQQEDHLSDEQKESLGNSIRNVDKEMEIISFKLDRTEKVKRTTAILLEETIEELEQKRKAVEEANSALQKSMEELKAAQAQLIHAEKMASLGELTAGIAHEIQNPLNFVNNFSEVSVDMVDELIEEMERGNQDEVRAIAGDLRQNLEKIVHHGKRASGIVKGMLEHSRAGSGDKVPTDISALADEYLRLAYHGLRAKDKSFNADFKLEADQSLPKINVIPQDIGRVLLNLINNAFYAVTARASAEAEVSVKASATTDKEYKPTVIVSIKNNPSLSGHKGGERDKESIEIRVQDNGNGIADDIKDKIFQPFFTTKPTGEGTGLGLSMSYDIITKGHGGDFKAETLEGKGTTFIIQLPIV
jgi:signal transduction histidine kinase